MKQQLICQSYTVSTKLYRKLRKYIIWKLILRFSVVSTLKIHYIYLYSHLRVHRRKCLTPSTWWSEIESSIQSQRIITLYKCRLPAFRNMKRLLSLESILSLRFTCVILHLLLPYFVMPVFLTLQHKAFPFVFYTSNWMPFFLFLCWNGHWYSPRGMNLSQIVSQY